MVKFNNRRRENMKNSIIKMAALAISAMGCHNLDYTINQNTLDNVVTIRSHHNDGGQFFAKRRSGWIVKTAGDTVWVASVSVNYHAKTQIPLRDGKMMDIFNDKISFKAELVAESAEHDLAIYRGELPGNSITATPLCEEKPYLGEQVMTAGYISGDFKSDVGEVTGNDYRTKTEAWAAPGMSGGPVINDMGDCVYGPIKSVNTSDVTGKHKYTKAVGNEQTREFVGTHIDEYL